MPDTIAPITIHQEKDVRVVEFTESKILEQANIDAISQRLSELLDGVDRPKLLLDFKQVDHLSSAALGVLITINKKVRDQHGQLRLVEIKPQIFEVFQITKLDRLFKILPTRADAMASFD